MGLRLWNMLCGGAAVSTAALTTVAFATELSVHRLREGVRPRHRFNVWQVGLRRLRQVQWGVHVRLDGRAVGMRMRDLLRG